jgi:hypothetical protein
LHLFAPRVISVEHILPFLKHLYILNPTLQFYQTISVWGVLLYLVFALNWRRLLRYDYLSVAMVSPLLTVFNPVFTDFFLRFSAGHTLWRFCFLIPLAFVAAWWLLDRVAALKQGRLPQRASALIAIALLIGLLFPFNTTYLVSPWSRVDNLRSSSNDAATQWIADLVSFLDQQDGTKKIITDPVTGYIVSAMTPHRSIRKKFFTPRINQLDPGYLADANNTKRVNNALLIINLRDGPDSDLGRRSGHWPNDILNISRHYDAALLAMVKSDRTRFQPIWEHDKVTVYRIASSK